MNSGIIGRRMRELRKKRGMTMADLSKKSGFSQPQISDLESGKRSFRSETLEKIAKALKVDMAYFVQDWAPDGTLKKLRLSAGLLEALHDPDFFLLVQKLANSRAGERQLLNACLALVDVFSENIAHSEENIS